MEKIKKWFGQGVRFALVGCLNTAVDTAVYYLLTRTAFFATYYLAAQAISYTCGVVNSLGLNKRFTFGQRGRMGVGRVTLFFTVNLVSLGVSSLALFVCVDRLNLSRMMGKAVAVICSMGVNFLLNKLLVFKDV